MKLIALAFASLAVSPQVTLTAATHTPKINTHWSYVVHASLQGKPVAARLTAQIIDPIGGVHPVLYANTKVKVVNRPFKGVFRDFLIWPKSARGVPLTLRVTVRSGGATKVVKYVVTPRA
jgi:hypothetical protein